MLPGAPRVAVRECVVSEMKRMRRKLYPEVDAAAAEEAARKPRKARQGAPPVIERTFHTCTDLNQARKKQFSEAQFRLAAKYVVSLFACSICFGFFLFVCIHLCFPCC